MPAKLTERARVLAALEEAQARLCGWIHGECVEPRAHGDHVCRAHRLDMDSRWKAIKGGNS